LSIVEVQQLEELVGLFEGFSYQPTAGDKWRWMPDSKGLFSVKSCYSSLLTTRQGVLLEANVLIAIKKLWKTNIPSKVNLFGWRLLLGTNEGGFAS
jgi:hypothetical protein